MDNALLRNSGFLKPNPYVEIIVDAKSARKTETIKNTYQPKWNKEFTILVTPGSVVHFKVLDHSSFRKDTLIGEKVIHLGEILARNNGRCENLELNVDLTKIPSSSAAQNSMPEQPRTPNKTGELVVVLNGLRIDPSLLHKVLENPISAVHPTASSEELAAGVANGGFGVILPQRTNSSSSSSNNNGDIRSKNQSASTSSDPVVGTMASLSMSPNNMNGPSGVSSGEDVGLLNPGGGAIRRNSGMNWAGGGGGGPDGQGAAAMGQPPPLLSNDVLGSHQRLPQVSF